MGGHHEPVVPQVHGSPNGEVGAKAAVACRQAGDVLANKLCEPCDYEARGPEETVCGLSGRARSG